MSDSREAANYKSTVTQSILIQDKDNLVMKGADEFIDLKPVVFDKFLQKCETEKSRGHQRNTTLSKLHKSSARPSLRPD